jgi:hypothetical protein
VARRLPRISARRTFRIAGQWPTVEWSKNKDGTKRTIKETETIAKNHGVLIPNDVVFFEAERGELEGNWQDLFTPRGMETARGPAMSQHADGYIYWNDHYNGFGKIPFLIHPEVLASDEAIVAVFRHEMFELAELREVFYASEKRRMKATDYGLQVAPGHRGNFHDQAWNAADEAVLRMRKDRQC